MRELASPTLFLGWGGRLFMNRIFVRVYPSPFSPSRSLSLFMPINISGFRSEIFALSSLGYGSSTVSVITGFNIIYQGEDRGEL
ncbi:hypothetical protein KFK09_013654 [Dendrobium nobile]|uniref:Uncharacterized protein n=1 Tax=Dendrobium nobile TaxID=94219 RepID=A0A8T3BDM0_DENNO|nr:hypothetical protein KFK09_013654 [Dendrobium nobile]